MCVPGATPWPGPWTGRCRSSRLVRLRAQERRMDLGIDLGTATTVVSDLRRGIVFDEPSVMLVRHGGGRRPQLQAVGREAAELLGRAPSRFASLRPLHDGVVTDLETARLYLRAVLARAGRRMWTP